MISCLRSASGYYSSCSSPIRPKLCQVWLGCLFGCAPEAVVMARSLGREGSTTRHGTAKQMQQRAQQVYDKLKSKDVCRDIARNMCLRSPSSVPRFGTPSLFAKHIIVCSPDPSARMVCSTEPGPQFQGCCLQHCIAFFEPFQAGHKHFPRICMACPCHK